MMYSRSSVPARWKARRMGIRYSFFMQKRSSPPPGTSSGYGISTPQALGDGCHGLLNQFMSWYASVLYYI